MKICPNCKRENEDDYLYCKYCGHKFLQDNDLKTVINEVKDDSNLKKEQIKEYKQVKDAKKNQEIKEFEKEESTEAINNKDLFVPEQNTSFKVCPECGFRNDSKAVYCKNCGYDLRLLEKNKEERNEKTSKIAEESKERKIKTKVYIPSNSNLNDFQLPQDLKRKFHWGASVFPFFWPFFYNQGLLAVSVILSLFVCPVYPLIISLYLGMNGYELAYKGKKYNSLEEFIKEQDNWNKWGIIFFVLSLIFTIAFIILFIYLIKRFFDMY